MPTAIPVHPAPGAAFALFRVHRLFGRWVFAEAQPLI